ncbi:MAG: hypothetical protein JSV89_04570 [Spirochaetaceae bacterium]|nr:MAG: hypothetical protein JSV89_04570 [Spirochaetaceae bacterium]
MRKEYCHTQRILRIAVFLGISVVFTLVLPADDLRGEADQSVSRRTCHLSYGIAISHDQLRDELLVPLRWVGAGCGLHLGWDIIGGAWKLHSGIGLALSYLEEGYGNGGAALTPSFVLEGYGRFRTRGTLTSDIGAVFRSRINDEQLYSWDDAHLYYLASYMIGPSIAFEWNLVPHRILHFKLCVPIIGFVGRPEEERFVKQEVGKIWVYFTEPNGSLGFTTLPKYFSIELSAGIDLKRKRSAFRFDYILSYERYMQPEPFVRFTNTVLLAHDLEFGRKR